MSKIIVDDDEPVNRTFCFFSIAGNPWPTIAAWAQRTGFLPRVPQKADIKLFQKSDASALFLCHDDHVELQAWVHVSVFARIITLFTSPDEIGLESGGYFGVVSRDKARRAVNGLLAEVGAPLIP